MVYLRYTTNLFLRSLCVVYLFAFVSFYVQIPGLYGDSGILPSSTVLENTKHKTLYAKVHNQPTLLWLAPYLGLDTNYALDVLALVGSFLAFTGFISQKLCTVPLFGALWSVYFSLYQVGQAFVANNYDELLLEVGFITLLVAPFLPGRRKASKGTTLDSISFWLVRWLLFRYILGSGLVKFISGCPKWWSLTAFDHHFETIPLPSPLSWYSHHLPKSFLKLVAVYANVCEIGLPPLFFIPFRSVRITAFVFQMSLQICIVLTGNFNYVNLLIVALLWSLLDDQFFYNKKHSDDSWISKAVTVVIYGVVLCGVVTLYSLKLDDSRIYSNIAFTKDQFNEVLKQGIPIVQYIGIISLGFTLFKCIFSLSYDISPFTFQKTFAIVTTFTYSGLAILFFVASTVPLASLHPATNSTIRPQIRTIYNRLHKLHAVNQYILFDKVKGIDGRQEIIIEGADNVEGPWHEYHFLYKPGNVNHSLPFVAPYSPRLDWQMYWAAYSTYEEESWLIALAHRLLHGKIEVLSLLDIHHTPFIKRAPKFIRASLYKYKYTSWSQKQSAAWWQRERVGEYFPVFSKDSPYLIEFLKARNLLPSTQKSIVNNIWKEALDKIRYITSHFEATLLLWSVFTAGCAIITTSGKKTKRLLRDDN